MRFSYDRLHCHRLAVSPAELAAVSLSFFAGPFASLAIVVFLSVICGLILGVLASFLLRRTKKRKTVTGKEPGTIPGSPGRTGS